MTMGSSWARSMAVKSSFVKVISEILGRPLVVIEWTDWIARWCFLWAELWHPPPANLPAIVFTCPVVYLGSRFYREGLLQIRLSLRPMFLEWNRTGYSIDDFSNVASWSLVPLRTLAPVLSSTYRTFTLSSLFGRTLVVVKTTWSFSSTPCALFFPVGGYLSLCENWYELVLVFTNLHKWPTWISSSIMSFSVWHPSIVWPKLRWY